MGNESSTESTGRIQFMNTQQRRPFFIKAAYEGRQISLSHPRRWGAVILTAALLFFQPGCASLTPERINLLVAIAGQAAQMGAALWLSEHPTHQDAFNHVITALTPLVKAGDTNKNVEILTSLPGNVPGVVTLKGKDGDLYVTDVLVVYDNESGKSTRITGEAVKPAMRVILTGLQAAVAPLPPDPKKARRMPLPRVQNASAPTAHVHPVGEWRIDPNRLVEAAPATPLSGRTYVTKSTVEIGAPTLSVKWPIMPRSVYHIEHGDGTNWRRVCSLTNATSFGTTNWVTPWPSGLPAGEWRVLRGR